MKIIGIYGLMGSGKSVFCEAFPIAYNLLNKTGRIYYQSLSADIKDEVSRIIGINMDQHLPFTDEYDFCRSNYDYSAKAKAVVINDTGSTIGRLLQQHGFHQKQLYGDRYWIDKALDNVKSWSADIDVAILDGVRYKCDVEAIREAGGSVIKIESFGISGQKDESRDSNHPSETELLDFKFDHVLPNQQVHNCGHHTPDVIRQIAVTQMVNTIVNRYVSGK